MATVLYCGTADGIATLRRDGEGPWKLTSRALQPFAVREMAVSPDAPNRVVAGTRGDGVWLSEDCGRTWSKPSYGRPGPGKVTSVSFDAREPGTIWAGGEPIELFVSHDLGTNWEGLGGVRAVEGVKEIAYPVATVEPHVRCIVADPANPKTMYIALQVGYILKTTDGGASWRMLKNGFDEDVHVIVIDPTRPETLFISTGGEGMRSGNAPGRSLYRSDDGGESWTPLAMEYEQEYSAALAMHPGDPKTLITCLARGNPGEWRRPSGPEAELIRTQDGGRSWEPLLTDVPPTARPFAGAIAYDLVNPDHIYLGARGGGLTASYDGGNTWLPLGVELPAVNDIKVAHI
jgi:photosystem II stability/assembly factor-like uncharacterized protein